VVRRAVLLTSSGKINSKVLPWEITNSNHQLQAHEAFSKSNAEPMIAKDLDLKDAAAKAEYDTIMNVLKEVNFNKTVRQKF
jgi:two-component system response regulator HydG